MNSNRKRMPWKASLFLSLALIPLAYLGSYFALLSVPRLLSSSQSELHLQFIEINGQWERYPDYRGFPKWFFAPVHHYDRTWLRPHLWSGTSPRNQELSFEWLSPIERSGEKRSYELLTPARGCLD
jgi:hypothetical protein